MFKTFKNGLRFEHHSCTTTKWVVVGRDEAEKLSKLTVYAREDDLPELEDGEYFLSDLLELDVQLEDGVHIGKVIDVIEGRGQNILLVAREGLPNVMIPMVDEFIVEIDFDSNSITIDPIEGLL